MTLNSDLAKVFGELSTEDLLILLEESFEYDKTGIIHEYSALINIVEKMKELFPAIKINMVSFAIKLIYQESAIRFYKANSNLNSEAIPI